MQASTAVSLLNLFNNLDLFFLITVRFLAFFLLIPVLSGQYVSTRIKISFAIFLALIIISSGNIRQTVSADSIFGYVALLLGEFAVGLIIGFIVYMAFSVLLLAGQIVDFNVGFSMVSVFDPVSQIQVPITGNLFYLAVTMIFVQTGGLNSFIHTVFFSYDVLPIGKAFVIGNSGIFYQVLQMMADFFVIGIKIALPVMGTIVLVDLALGILTKAVPQMNVFVVGMPIKLFIGLIVLYATAPLLSEFYRVVYDVAVKYTMTVIKGMIG